MCLGMEEASEKGKLHGDALKSAFGVMMIYCKQITNYNVINLKFTQSYGLMRLE